MQLITNPVRKVFAPLTITGSVRVLTPDSPLVQSYDSITGVISPDRSGPDGTPLCLLPELMMTANDGSLSRPYDNTDIIIDSAHPLVWYAGGKDIRTVLAETTDYDIDTTGGYDEQLGADTRGMLTFRRNLAQGEELEIYFECYVRDKRTGRYVHVVSQPVTLRTAERGLDEYTLIIGGPHHFTYNPVNDTRLEYEYCTAHGMESEVPETETDDVSYLHTWTIGARQGSVAITNYKIKVYEKGSTTELGEDASDGVISITTTELTIDTRLRDSRQFEIAAFLTGSDGSDVEIDRVTVGYSTYYPRIDAVPINQTGYNPGDTVRSNALIISARSLRLRGSTTPSAGRIRHPERLMNITWYGRNSLNSERITLGEGSQVTYKLSKLSLGDNEDGDTANKVASCNYVEDCDGDWKRTLSVATDEDGSVLTDSDGNVLAFY